MSAMQLGLFQSDPFDAPASERGKEIGMQQAAENKKALLTFARKIARELAEKRGTISMDDIAFELHSRDISIFALGNSAGSVFMETDEDGNRVWQWTGDMVKSVREHAHSNLLRTWRLKKDA